MAGSRVATTTLLPTGTWVLDPRRAQVVFSGRASRLAPTFRASFGSVTGTVHVDDAAHLAVDIDVTSVSTGNRAWDELLRGLDPFEARYCPRATYRGTADLTVGRHAHVAGELELRGIRQPVALAAAVRPAGDEVHVTATGTIDRRAFGVRCDLPGVGRFVPAVMRLDITVTAVRAGAVPQQR
jgi:polyisoprenoid-binding protein YceI